MSNGIAPAESPSGLNPASIWSTFFWICEAMLASEASSGTVVRSMRLRPSSVKAMLMPLTVGSIHLPPTTFHLLKSDFFFSSIRYAAESSFEIVLK